MKERTFSKDVEIVRIRVMNVDEFRPTAIVGEIAIEAVQFLVLDLLQVFKPDLFRKQPGMLTHIEDENDEDNRQRIKQSMKGQSKIQQSQKCARKKESHVGYIV